MPSTLCVPTPAKLISMSAKTLVLGALLLLPCAAADSVPKVWDDHDVADFRLPLAGLGHSPRLISEKEYYALPEVNLKTYPVYTPDKEPAGYIDWLNQQEPQRSSISPS
jgi:hypothetical protein